MITVKTILIILLSTATLAAATERAVLWFGNWDDIYEVDVDGGSIYYSFSKPNDANHGLGYDGIYFWSERYADTVVEFDKNGLIISTFDIPEGVLCEGIEYDNNTLWLLIFFTPDDTYVYHTDLTGSVMPPAPFKVHYLANDLAYDGEYIWIIAGEGTDCDVLCYDPNTGALLDSFPVGDPYYYGTETRTIATDGTYIYTIGWEHFLDGQNWIYKFTKTGTELEHIYTPLPGLGVEHTGLSYYEEGVTVIEPVSLGKLKALYK